MLVDERSFTPRRYHVLLASKQQGKVWSHRGEDYMLTASGTIETVTGVTHWLRTVGLMEPGDHRSLGGRFLVPTAKGREKLEAMIPGVRN